MKSNMNKGPVFTCGAAYAYMNEEGQKVTAIDTFVAAVKSLFSGKSESKPAVEAKRSGMAPAGSYNRAA